MSKITRYLVVIFIVFSCTVKENHENTKADKATDNYSQVPKVLKDAWLAHGSVDVWKSYSMLEYDMDVELNDHRGSEHQTIALDSRRIMIEGKGYSIGFDGKDVWALPAVDSIEISPRFYHSLFFYFFAIPMVLSDPGINYEELEPLETDSITYSRLRISFDIGVGDSPEDYYILHFNSETKRLEWLLYTVTYFSGEAHERFNGLLYQDYRETHGLLMPHRLIGRRYSDGMLGAIRYHAYFSNVKFVKEAPEDDMFAIPEGAEIDSLRNND